MSWNDHDHRGEYAREDHDHYHDYADKRHDHYDLERAGETAQQEIRSMREEVRGLHDQLDEALGRIVGLEKQTPQARQLQLEADQAAADLAESGYRDDDYGAPVGADRHGRSCRCPFCYYDPEDGEDQADEPGPAEYDPGPEVDDQGGMSEYRYVGLYSDMLGWAGNEPGPEAGS